MKKLKNNSSLIMWSQVLYKLNLPWFALLLSHDADCFDFQEWFAGTVGSP